MTLSTRAEIRREALRRAGGFVEDLTGTQDAMSVISDGMRYRFGGDDTGGVGMAIYEPTGAAADQLRIATTWDDSDGDATVDSLSAAMSAGDTVEYYLRSDPTPHEFNEAINRVLSETERVVESWLPTIEGVREYTFLNAPWVEARRDVLRVLKRESPNILSNSGFELWGRGSDAQLQSWVLTGTNATVTRLDGTHQRFAARLTRSGDNAELTQTIPIPVVQLIGEQISIFGRVRSGTASVAKLRVNDGQTTSASTAHAGGSDWEELSFTHTVSSTVGGPLQVLCQVITSDTNADFENVVAVEGSSVPEWLRKYGDQHARTKPIHATVQMSGLLPVVATDRTYGRGSQIVVQSKQPYFELTADSGTGGVTDLPFECAVTGTIVKLAEVHSVGKPNAARWERLGAYWLPKYNAWKRKLAEPSPDPAGPQAAVGGV